MNIVSVYLIIIQYIKKQIVAYMLLRTKNKNLLKTWQNTCNVFLLPTNNPTRAKISLKNWIKNV